MAAGKVDFPDYMKQIHENWLDGGGSPNLDIENSVVKAMNDAQGASPFSSASAFNPTSDITAITDAVESYNTLVDGIDKINDWKAIVDATGYNSTGVDTYDDILTDQLEANTLPKYKAGMRNIGAVMSSAYSIGESVIYAFKNRDVAQHASQLAREAVNQMIHLYDKKLEGMKNWMASVIETRRIAIVSQKEQQDTDNSLSENDARWDLETFQYGANVMAAISGGPSITSGAGAKKSPSTSQSAIGGALSGAALGAAVASTTDSVSSGWGALGGAAMGAAASFL